MQELEQKFMYPELQLRKGTQPVLLCGLDLVMQTQLNGFNQYLI